MQELERDLPIYHLTRIQPSSFIIINFKMYV
jgi:hypothetical protein